MLDAKRIRRDFPILDSGIIYLDNAASSLTPEPVIQKMLEFYHNYRANVERGIHRFSQKASEEYEKAHAKVADFINAESETEIILTRNATEAINLVASGLTWEKRDKIVTSLVEHHSNFIVWLRLKKRYGVDVEIVRPSREGLFDIVDFEKAIDNKTRLVALTHVSNVLGVKTPVDKVAEIAHDHDAHLLVDGAQSVPHLKVDVKRAGCDYLAFSGHKMLGPTGVGVLYARKELLDNLEPLSIGGGTIADVGVDYYTLAESPTKFEAGTPAVAEAIGLGAAVDYLREVKLENIEVHERKLMKRMYQGLADIPSVEVYGPKKLEQRTGIVSFNVGDLNPHDVALALDVSADILVRSGHHCCLPLNKELLKRHEGTVRASVYLYNTEAEVEKMVSAVNEIARSLT
ncbi:MAG: cysteine desulfurase [Candidatus Bathyarchaeota archaeon]|nr:cysteine desulfurase [Candidatus Bathyarchaeota archaeon]MDH5664270.1 cysteine desulfurase [Candidatus Bathyarchaeota archaeon]